MRGPSGAGRIVTLRMRPLSLAERRLAGPSVSLASLLTGDRPDVGGGCETTLGDCQPDALRDWRVAYAAATATTA